MQPTIILRRVNSKKGKKMAEDEREELFTTAQVVEKLGVPYYRLQYAYAAKRVPKPRMYGNRRLYSLDDIEKMKTFLELG